MIKTILRTALMPTAAAFLLILGVGQASADPQVTPGPAPGVDGILFDSLGLAAYPTCLVVGPGVGMGSSPAPPGTGTVTGFFFAPGPVTAFCTTGGGSFSVGGGAVG